jgi:hypothetical protein
MANDVDALTGCWLCIFAVKVRVQDKGCVDTDWEHYCHQDGKRARWLHLTGAIEKG